ncbi:MAG: TonB-dependent receptor [Opitutae bacterium]|nr:TonB-dependent receptor [Opitutae bacterium]
MRRPAALFRRLAAGTLSCDASFRAVARAHAAACLALALATTLTAAPVELHIPAQPAADALLAFSQQAHVEVLFAFDELNIVHAHALDGTLEPDVALARLLAESGFAAFRYSGDKYVVRSVRQAAGTITGRLLLATSEPAAGVTVALAGTRLSAVTDASGHFSFPSVPPGRHQLFANAAGWHPLRIDHVEVEAGRISKLDDQRFQPARELETLEPYVVEGRSARLRPIDDSAALLGPRRATGNLDLPRGENDALPFTIYTREQITRSGVVALNEFLQRAILEGDATARPPEQSGSFDLNDGLAGSTNLKLRGYEENETVILINGRRLPEVQTSVGRTQPADVNFIPLSLIQQVEVLPASASAIYSGNPVGGVINIVLRPDVTATEVNATYTNATAGYDAPQTSFSLQHGQSLLDHKLRVRLNAVLTAVEPPTETELGYRRRRDARQAIAADSLYRATPNVRSADGTPLFGAGSASFTSVAPGADGLGGLAAFNGRAGVAQRDFYDSPAGLSASPLTLDSPYGRRQRRQAFFGSVTYDPWPWLQVGVDATHSRTVMNRGLDVLTGNLTLAAASPLNPLGQDVAITLVETAPQLGENYSEARIDFSSAVGGLLLRLPRDWRLSADAQVSRNIVKYRGLSAADPQRWQALVDQGLYNPLRDTQRFVPPQAFYDSVLVYRGGRDRFVTLGDYRTLDVSARVSNQELTLPTGRASMIAGADYRLLKLADYTEQTVYADGSPAADPTIRDGRQLERYSFFAETQAPLVPRRWLPKWLHEVEADVAVRYIASDQSNEVNTVPTLGLKAAFAGGVTFRGSVTSSKRFPTPQLSKQVSAPGGPGGGVNQELIVDPRRNESYLAQIDDDVNIFLPPEDAITQTAGLVFERGDEHHFRASLDFIDTQKTNEIISLDAKQTLALETLLPDRVQRAAPGPGETVGRVTRLIVGSINASSRHSQNWTLAFDYSWTGVLGGTLEARARGLYYQRYERQVFTGSPTVDQLNHPDGLAPGLLRYRANFGVGWSNRTYGFGLDGQYFHARRLPAADWAAQGSDRVAAYWQFDAYAQADLIRLLRLKTKRYGLRGQLRVNNLSDFDYPKYANDGAAAAGVQPYGDWRGRTYSLSVTATF